mmetsp:Transcript_18362/g.50992  ORF Transcript_18362/g.50992 Transcript_18362/m.50992 type:complete len:246 (-) Transcript_18362:231-968(-)
MHRAATTRHDSRWACVSAPQSCKLPSCVHTHRSKRRPLVQLPHHPIPRSLPGRPIVHDALRNAHVREAPRRRVVKSLRLELVERAAATIPDIALVQLAIMAPKLHPGRCVGVRLVVEEARMGQDHLPVVPGKAAQHQDINKQLLRQHRRSSDPMPSFSRGKNEIARLVIEQILEAAFALALLLRQRVANPDLDVVALVVYVPKFVKVSLPEDHRKSMTILTQITRHVVPNDRESRLQPVNVLEDG